MKEDIFEKARNAINEGLVRGLFDKGKSKTDHHHRELKISCPYRTDTKIGNFSINLDTGYWIDYANNNEGGDIFQLLVKTYGITLKEAAHRILGTDYVEIDYKKKEKKEKKYKPVVPVPQEKLKLLTRHINYDIIIKKFGKAVSGWKMRMADGEVWMCIARHVREGKKQDIPYSYNTDGKWHAGWSMNKNCPLYGIENVKTDSKIIITEGLKCGDVEVSGRVSISWHGGVNSIDKYDWTAIENHDCVMWPDLDKQLDNEGNLRKKEDQPGLNAALIIQEKLSNCQILDVHTRFGTAKPPGWDIFDARHESIDLEKFIEECERYERKENRIDKTKNISDSSGVMDGNNVNIRTDSTIAEFENYIEEDIEDDEKEGFPVIVQKNVSTTTPGQANGTNENNQKAVDPNRNKKETKNEIYDPSTQEDDDNAPFKYLGFDDGSHYFLPKGSNIVKKIKFGSFTLGKLLELASLSFWSMMYPKPKGGFYLESAMDDLIRESEYRGYFDPEKIRGAGFWLDEERIIVNNGKNIFDENGNKLKNFKSKYFYVISDKNMGDFSGRVSTEEEGWALKELFITQGFENNLEAFLCLGWALMAPFASLLKWRPHIWITGPKSSGKSWLLENLVHPLTGPFTFIGSGSDSAPGLYRSLWRDPSPVIKDEMEPGTSKEARKKIDDTLEVVRNASANFSSYKTVANQSGSTDRFCIRSPFCLSSIVPYMPNPALESRILVSRIKNSSLTKSKYEETKKIMATGLMVDPGIFRRRIFKNIRSFLKNVEIIEKHLLDKIGDIRKTNNLAPIFAALYALVNEGVIEDENKINKYIDLMTNQIEKADDQSDEDKLLRELFDYPVRTQDNENVSIAELILDGEFDSGKESYKQLLQRQGIKIYVHPRDGIKYLAIVTNTRSIKNILKDTMYNARYVNVIERHESAIPKEETKSGTQHRRGKFAGQNKYAVHLKWEEIKERYFEHAEEKNAIIQDLINTF